MSTMRGRLYYESARPAVGTRVTVVVRSFPEGIWDGELVEVGEDELNATSRGEWNPLTERSVSCRVRLFDDPRMPAERRGQELYCDYSVYAATAGTQYLRRQLTEAQNEIRGLKRRIEIERDTWHAALKALVNPDGFKALKELLEQFAARLGR